MRQLLVGLAVVLSISLGIRAQAPDTSPQENAAMESAAASQGLGSDLHTIDKDPDGTRRIGVGVTTTRPQIAFVYGYKDANGTMHRSPYRNEDEAEIRNAYCSAYAIVTAKSVNSKAHLTGNKHAIYTKTSFQIEKVLKPAADLGVGQIVSVSSLGGKVQDGSDTLEVVEDGAPPFIPGKVYLLLLRQPAGAKSVYLVSRRQAIPVIGGILRPARESVLAVCGERIGSVKARLDQLVKRVPCAQQ